MFLIDTKDSGFDEKSRHDLTIKIQKEIGKLPRYMRDAILEDMIAHNEQEDSAVGRNN